MAWKLVNQREGSGEAASGVRWGGGEEKCGRERCNNYFFGWLPWGIAVCVCICMCMWVSLRGCVPRAGDADARVSLLSWSRQRRSRERAGCFYVCTWMEL